MARLGEIQFRGDGSDPRQVMNYLRQLEAGIRHVLANLDAGNIAQGSIDETLLAPKVTKDLKSISESAEEAEKKNKKLQKAVSDLQTGQEAQGEEISDIKAVLEALGLSESGVDMPNVQIDENGNVDVKLRSIKLFDGAQYVDVTAAILALIA